METTGSDDREHVDMAQMTAQRSDFKRDTSFTQNFWP